MLSWKSLMLVFSAWACQGTRSTVEGAERQNAAIPVGLAQDTLKKIVKSDAEWKAQLSDKAFYVLRKKGTERSFTGKYWDNKKEGTYVCAGCQLPLFSSDTKYKSGTGWPSFWEPIASNHVAEEKDYTHGMTRVEVLCNRCDGHLGHVFNDGPRPTGLRYCINSVSLDFIPKQELQEQ